MTKVTHNLGFKVLALFLVVISGVVSLLSTTAVMMGGEHGFYSGNPKSYYETPWCKLVTNQYTEEIIDLYRYNPHRLDSWGEREGKNIGFEILSPEGEILMEENVPEAYGTIENYDFYLYGENTAGDTGEWYEYDEPMNMTLKAYIREPLTGSDDYWLTYRLYGLTYRFRMGLLLLAFTSILTFLASFIYLMCAAGHKGKTDEIVPNLQDRIPLELYFGGIMMFASVSVMGGEFVMPFDGFSDFVLVFCMLIYVLILFIASCMTIATRLKMGRWWRNSITYWIFHIGWKFTGGVFTTLRDTITALPMTWKYAAVWIFISLIYLVNSDHSGTVFLVNCIVLVLVLSVSNQMQKLRRAGEQLAGGNLEYKVDTSKMFRAFRKHGNNLNSLSKGAAIAMEQKIKSERLKTELITNVSHDIKTPLTSIINYVDLLKKVELPVQAQEYLEVLDRQSRRLKKLTEDLVEASKASTGNISANLVPTDLCELVHQAVAEYEEKLEKAGLEAVITAAEPIYGMVDGNLTWRVLSNLLSNACKYSLPGTRVYIEILKKGNYALISMKNTSRNQLNIAADELMERFVRGDSSRSTEGSGLGLNIAKSLAELQKGKFSLSIEGDLFKAFVKYPVAKAPVVQPKEEAPEETAQSEAEPVEEEVNEKKA